MTFNLEKEGLEIQKEDNKEESNSSKSKDIESLQEHYEKSIEVDSNTAEKKGLK